MKRFSAIVTLSAALAGCGKADGELTPGMWNSTMTMSKFEVPGAPPAMAAQVKAMLGKEQKTSACMSPAQARLGVREMSSSMQQGDCKMENFTQGDGRMAGTMVCTGTSGFGAPRMTMTGTYSPEKVTMTLAGEASDSRLPGGKANLELTISSERTGDCKS